MTACISGEYGGDSYYVEARLPAVGELAIELTGEGVLTAHVDLVCDTYSSQPLDTATLTEVTRETLGAYTYAGLRGLFAAEGAPARHRALEEELETAFNSALGEYGDRYTVALTLVALTV
jgi:hypothetical protein